MTQPNRETARDGLATLLEAQLVTTDAIVEVVYNYRKGDLQGQSPVVVVTSGGSARERLDFTGTRSNIAYLTVYVFVAYAAEGWTEAQAEDRLDLIERTIADVVDANSGTTAYWVAMDYDGRSTRDDVEDGGIEYIREIISIAAQLSYA